jgi:hypothetical protein
MLEMDQICLWVVGLALHDDQHCLCVPDMSCCVPGLLAPREVREAYLGQFDADPRRAKKARLIVGRMHLRFLHQLILAGGPEAYLPSAPRPDGT